MKSEKPDFAVNEFVEMEAQYKPQKHWNIDLKWM